MPIRRRLVQLLSVLVTTLVLAPAAHAASGVILDFDAVEGQPYFGKVAQFSDVYTDGAPVEAVINWGDDVVGSSVVKPIAGGDGEYSVAGSHTYIEAGKVPVSVRLQTTQGSLVAQAAATRTVADAPLTAVRVDLNWDAGVAYPGAAGGFTDANLRQTDPTEFNATVDWGDGTGAVDGHVEARADGAFKVFAGQHTWATPGTKTVTTIVKAKHGSTVTVVSTFRVAGQLAADFTYTPSPPCANQVVEFNARTSVSGLRIVNYHWDVSHNDAFGTTQKFDGVYPIAEFTFHYTSTEIDLATGQPKRYSIQPATVKLTVTDEAGNKSTITKTVRFADDGFRPTADQPRPDCDALRQARLSRAIKITRAEGAWRFKAPCAKVADCALLVRITDRKNHILASGAEFVHAGDVASIPLRSTTAGRRYRRCRVWIVIRFTAVDGTTSRVRRRGWFCR